jgi:GNAT superfamily N-acetyltransferase
VERHNGVWGGCWCIAFHPEGGQRGTDHRAQKEQRVRDGEAHAALVFDDNRCVGWCQFGAPEELPRIKFGRAYRELAERPPDWRITCFFVDKSYRHEGVAAAALKGALREIARLGGGTVESSPEDVEGRKVSNSFLYNATVAMFEQQGFVRVRQLGKNNWLVTKKVRATRV